MEETNPTPVESVEAGQSQSESVVVSPISPKNPMLYVGIGAIIIIILGLVFLFSKEKQPETPSDTVPTVEVTVEPTEVVSSDTTGVEVQERTEAEAIQISDADSDLQDISQDLKEL